MKQVFFFALEWGGERILSEDSSGEEKNVTLLLEEWL